MQKVFKNKNLMYLISQYLSLCDRLRLSAVNKQLLDVITKVHSNFVLPINCKCVKTWHDEKLTIAKYRPYKCISRKMANIYLPMFAVMGNYRAMRYLIEELGADIHFDKDFVFTNAAEAGRLDIMRYLLSLEDKYGKIDIHADGEAPFALAASNGNTEVLKFLLSFKHARGKVNIHTHNDEPFRFALKGGFVETAKFLLSLQPEYGKIEVVNNMECWISIITIIAEDDQYESMKFLLENFKFKNLAKNEPYAYEWAAVNGNKRMFNLLYSYDKKFPKGQFGRIFVAACAAENSSKMVEYIWSLRNNKRRKISIKKIKDAAFCEAAEYGRIETLKYLLKFEDKYGKINIHCENEKALSLALRFGHLETAKFIISLEKSHGRFDIQCAIADAMRSHRTHIVKFLLSLEARYGKIDIHADDDTALLDMIDRRFTDIYEYLFSLEKTRGKFNINQTDFRGVNLFLESAVARGNIKLAKFLIDKGVEKTKVYEHFLSNEEDMRLFLKDNNIEFFKK